MTDEQCNKIMKELCRGFGFIGTVLALMYVGMGITSCAIIDISRHTKQIAQQQEPPHAKP